MSELTSGQLDTLRHMLGINDPDKRRPEPYRNYAAVNPGDPEYLALEAAGMVEQYQTRAPTDYHYYRCTDAGRLAAIRSFRTIQYSKPARRYSKFLDCRECCEGLTFHEFLTAPEWEESRRSA